MKKFDLINEIIALQKVVIYLKDDKIGRAIYADFNARHPRYWFIRKKTVGVALLKVPDDPENLIRGKEKLDFRKNINRAKNRGYKFAEYIPAQYVTDTLEINRSSDERQGRPMAKSYTERNSVEEYCKFHQSLLGVFSRENKLVAYLELLESGEIATTARIIGHDEHLKEGVMSLLMYGCIEYCVRQKHAGSNLRWIMYDMMFGAKPGLRHFKEKVGFSPYRVRWVIQ